MKKILSALVLLSLLAVLLVPMVALAQPKDKCTLKHDLTITTGAGIDDECIKGQTVGGEGSGATNTTNAWGLCCALDGVYTATDWVFVVLIAVVAILIIWGAFTIVTAGGAPEKVSSGRNYIVYALIGLAVALLAKALPSIVKALLGV